MKISQVLKEQRKEHGITQEELAEKILVSKKTISNWETGKTTPDLESLIRLSELFNLSLDELIKGDEKVMKKIKKDTDTVASNKRVSLIIFTWIVIYVSLLIGDKFLDIPQNSDPFINGLLIMLASMIGVSFFFEKKI